MKHFTCPHCDHTQPMRKLLTLSSSTTWRCESCYSLLKPHTYNPIVSCIAGAIVLIPALVFQLKYNFGLIDTLLVVAIIGVITLTLIVLFFYRTIKFKIL